MNLGSNGVSLGGAAAGTVILVLVVQRWWLKGKKGAKGEDGGGGRDWRQLVPFTLSGLYGVLTILCAGGLLGGAGKIVLWGGNKVGDFALVYGVGGRTTDVTRASLAPLSDGGNVMVLIATAMVIGAFKWSKKLPKKQLALGVICGICLGLNGGVAGALATPLANFANAGGAWWSGVVQ
ncbi:hypothetical protein [Streptomyces coffeae]|uniref:YeeE/YedE family protein n=1 Tax=Streptomyces coffeae TaxID=621382 RepID=A0ABS1NJ38_9ACTN|nr:hypothetical protein [Streptomyces coffeae]MBL1100129.1 hypothetical protein [Streptomyces coffeae]